MATVSVFDVVQFVLRKHKSEITAMKLQKIVYYCQAWSLVWDDKRLFKEKIRAWANGPVVRELFNAHKGQYKVTSASISHGDMNKLDEQQKATITSVLSYYGDKSPQWLSDLTHMEVPWKNARKGIPEGERGDVEITLESMLEYYSNLPSK